MVALIYEQFHASIIYFPHVLTHMEFNNPVSANATNRVMRAQNMGSPSSTSTLEALPAGLVTLNLGPQKRTIMASENCFSAKKH